MSDIDKLAEELAVRGRTLRALRKKLEAMGAFPQFKKRDGVNDVTPDLNVLIRVQAFATIDARAVDDVIDLQAAIIRKCITCKAAGGNGALVEDVAGCPDKDCPLFNIGPVTAGMLYS